MHWTKHCQTKQKYLCDMKKYSYSQSSCIHEVYEMLLKYKTNNCTYILLHIVYEFICVDLKDH